MFVKLEIIEDVFNGVTIKQESLPNTIKEFNIQVEDLCRRYKSKNLLWAKIPASKSDFIHPLCQKGFQFHHCNEQFLMLVKSLKKNAIIPPYNEYAVGVGAIVLNANGQLLVIKDRLNKGYKLPGGHIDRGELITEALAREVKEETGVLANFESIVNLGHFSRTQFGATFYIVCVAKVVSEQIDIEDTEEIIEAKWMDIDSFLEDDDINHYNKSVVNNVLRSSNNQAFSVQRVQLSRPRGEVFF